MPKIQDYKHHVKFDPAFHFFLAPMFLLTALWAICRLVRNPSIETGWLTVLAFALLVMVFKIRLYALRVQDRVIRLEERLRLSTLLPDSLRSRINDLTEAQLVGIRFASDAEVPALVEKTLANNLAKAEIKKAIVNWRPDYFRI